MSNLIISKTIKLNIRYVHMNLMSDTYQKTVYSQSIEQNDIVRNEILRDIIKNIVKTPGQNLLDVGCGNGHLLAPFVPFHNCYGVDLVESSLLIAKSKGIATYYTNLEKETLPFQSNFFDLTVCSEVIEHICNTDNLLNELNRVIRKNGYLILTFPNVNQPISWLAQIVFDFPPVYSARYKSPHVRDFTLRIIKKILPVFGFDIKNVRGTDLYPSVGKLSQWVAKNIPRVSEKIVVVSTKKRKPQKTANVVWDTRLL
jgi:methionine biosynthesis protein MetW